MGTGLPTDAEVIVILTPEKEAVQELQRGLEQAGYQTIIVVKSLEELRAELGRTSPSLVLLDRTHYTLESIHPYRPQSKALFVSLWLRERGCTEEQYVHDLEAGAADVMSRQTTRQIVAKLRALLRRERVQTAAQEVLRAGPLRMDLDKHEVRVHGKLITLTPKEFAILQCFLGAPGRVFSRDEMLDRVWGKGQALEEHALDVHIHALRRKIRGTRARSNVIITVRKFGYKLNL
jgi:DNA-binding response OmpR family regulator